MIDPNSTIHATREVRVTARIGITTPFVAPDRAPVPLLDRELEKGLKGWTDFDCKLVYAPYNPRTGRGISDHQAKGHADRQLEELTVGTAVIRKVTVRRTVKRPTTRRWK